MHVKTDRNISVYLSENLDRLQEFAVLIAETEAESILLVSNVRGLEDKRIHIDPHSEDPLYRRLFSADELKFMGGINVDDRTSLKGLSQVLLCLDRSIEDNPVCRTAWLCREHRKTASAPCSTTGMFARTLSSLFSCVSSSQFSP